MAFRLQIGLEAIASYRRLSYTPWHAIAEFVDNSTQAYLDNRDALDQSYRKDGDMLYVSIAYDPGTDAIMVSDNSAGMSREELDRALHIAHAPPNPSGRSRYGMGMKTAACWLGNRWTIRTKRYDSDEEYFVEVDVARVAGGDADLREQVKSALDARHYTIIEILGLNHHFRGRTLGKIKDFLRSMYRQDLRGGWLRLLWRGEELAWDDLDDEMLRNSAGEIYKHSFSFTLANGKSASGWVGVLERGSRAKAGFSILHSGRVVKGWPDAWRPASLYGQMQGSNDLINQRLVGEIHLDDFDVSHTKDDILWVQDEEDQVEDQLLEVCRPYREVARSYRKGAEQRGPSELETESAIEELRREIESAAMIDAISLEEVPPPEAITQGFQDLIEAEEVREPTFTAAIGDLEVRGYLSNNRSPFDPYFVCDATREHQVVLVINQVHPHWGQLVGTEGVLNFLRHCCYDAIAEHMARFRKSTIEPDTIKMYKDQYLRLPLAIERSEQDLPAVE